MRRFGQFRFDKSTILCLEFWPAKMVHLGFVLEVRLPTSIHLRARLWAHFRLKFLSCDFHVVLQQQKIINWQT